jgi:hypothetical protein
MTGKTSRNFGCKKIRAKNMQATLQKYSEQKNQRQKKMQPALQKKYAILLAKIVSKKICGFACVALVQSALQKYAGASEVANGPDTNTFFHIPPLFTTTIPISTTSKKYYP